MKSAGFTIIELLVVMGILGMLASLGLLVSLDFYRSYAFNSERDTVIVLLQKARSQSLANINQLPHGVHFEPSGYTLFQGAVYKAGDVTNTVFPADSHIANTGITNIIFEQLSGNIISGVGTLTLDDNSHRQTQISINSLGRVEW